MTKTKIDLQERVFLGVTFDIAPQSAWLDLMLAPPGDGPFAWIVTPNVDHMVRISKDPDLAKIYAQADWHLCDSRILNKLARHKGEGLAPYPGSDLVADLLSDSRAPQMSIAVIGPSSSQFDLLHSRYRELDLHFIDTPHMSPGSADWEATLRAVEKAACDILLVCISFPKQEYFAHALKTRGVARGRALCVGASLDFLTGEQQRAPSWMQKISLEWLYRLLSNPRRLWKRYLVEGPQIFRLYLREMKR